MRGLDKKRIREEGRSEAAEAASAEPLEPPFPYSVSHIDLEFFGIPANPEPPPPEV